MSVHDNLTEARDAVRQQFANFPRSPFYVSMFQQAGFPESAQGTWSDAMIDAIAFIGNEAQVTEKLTTLLSYGAAEVLASPTPAGPDPDASWDRTVRLLGEVGKSLS